MFKDAVQYNFELDGASYSLSGDTLKQVPDFKDLEGTSWLISDMSEAVSQFITVDAPINNAEFVVRQQLQESGEFEGPVTIISHFKKKKGSNSTDILFTAVPTNIYNSYTEMANDSEDVLLLFPINLVLLNVLQNFSSKNPVAVIFQHNRFADMIIGSKNKIYYANRCVAFTTEQEQIDQLWDSALKDIEMAERDHRIEVEKIIPLNWIDSSDLPEWDTN